MIEKQLLTRNPFPGLRPFEIGEECLFFGRDGHCDSLLETLRATHFAAVVGTSGSGKSSLVRAGLLPALRGGFLRSAGTHWKIAVFRPENTPIRNLANALNAPDVFGTGNDENVNRSSGNIEATLRHSSFGLIETVRQAGIKHHENLLLVIDQFEELYRFQADSLNDYSKDEVSAFIKLFLEAARQTELQIYTVLTIRSEYLGESARFWGLPEAINSGQYLIPRMTDDERREAIVGPITICGGEITLPLVNRLLNDAGDSPNQLPILQHALMRTWEYWKQTANDKQPLDIRHYEKVGGMANALSLHANEAYYELSGADRKIAEKLFKCLTERDTGKGENRRHATLSEICEVTGASEDEVINVIETFRRQGRSFLLPPQGVTLKSNTLIDISHESLIRGWERLKDWVEDEAQSARIYLRLAENATLRQEGKESLLKDPGLQVVLNWRDKYEPGKSWARRYASNFVQAMSYLNESKRQRDLEVSIEKKLGRRRLITAWMIAAILAVLVLFASYNYYRVVNAQRQIKVREELSELHDATIEATLAKKTEPIIETYKALFHFYERSELANRSEKQLSIAQLMLRAVANDRSGPNPLAPKDTSNPELLAPKDKSNPDPFAPKYSNDPSSNSLNSYSKQAMNYFEQASDRCKETFGTDKKAMFYMEIGDLISSNPSRDLSDAIFFYDKAIDLWEGKDFEDEKASAFVKKGDALSRLEGPKELEEAIESYRRAIYLQTTAIDKSLKSGDKSKSNPASIYIKIGSVYKKLNRRKDAIDAFSTALNISVGKKYEEEQVNALLELGDLFIEPDSARASEYFNQAINVSRNVSKETGKGGAIGLIRQIGDKYKDKGMWNQAINFYKKIERKSHQ